jgi:hypothetical protein
MANCREGYPACTTPASAVKSAADCSARATAALADWPTASLPNDDRSVD